MVTMRRAVFLDRDGVLTIPEFRDGRSFAPRTLEAFRLYPDAAGAVSRLKEEGFLVIVVTNQPDITVGTLSPDVLEAMHLRLRAACPIDAIEVSTATRSRPDRRRKPAPGMLLDAAAMWDIDLPASFMVGDRASDVECGRSAGVRTVFVDLAYSNESAPETPDAVASNLTEAVDWICAVAPWKKSDG